MKWKVLVSAPYMQPFIDRFHQIFVENSIQVILPPVEERMEEDDLLKYISDVDGVICGDDRFTMRVLSAASKLKVISKWGTGIDSIDQSACKEMGIKIRNTPNAFSEPVADSVIGYMLCFIRSLLFMDRDMKAGLWNKIPGKSLDESVLGIIGVGDVGKAVFRKAACFGMRIFGNDIAEMPAEFLSGNPIEMLSKEKLLAESDFISIHCDLNPTSHHLMDYEAFSRMKPTAVVINTARGPIIHEKDLVRALEEGKIGGAALDVFEHEPLPADSPLKKMDNVMLAPHNANSSPKAWEHVHINTIDNLITELREYDN